MRQEFAGAFRLRISPFHSVPFRFPHAGDSAFQKIGAAYFPAGADRRDGDGAITVR